VLIGLSPQGPAATVVTSAVETGTGLHDLIRQTVGTTLGIPAARIAIRAPEDPATLPCSPAITHPAWIHGSAVEAAAKQARTDLFAPVAEHYGVTKGLLEVRDGFLASHDNMFRVPLAEAFEQCLKPGQVTRGDGEFRMLTPSGSAGSAEATLAVGAVRAVVDVDTELGLVRVVQVAVAQDAGRVIVPSRAETRVAAGAVAGTGFVLSEGADLPYGWGAPTSMDQPEVVVAALLETANEKDDANGHAVSQAGSQAGSQVGNPLSGPPLGGMKPVGDLSLMGTPAAVLAAVRDAVGGAVQGVPLRLPLRPDRAWWLSS
jgi:CO/xanthine dehydrogenase Mo-binding subunit